jgi:hypothetical protein
MPVVVLPAGIGAALSQRLPGLWRRPVPLILMADRTRLPAKISVERVYMAGVIRFASTAYKLCVAFSFPRLLSTRRRGTHNWWPRISPLPGEMMRPPLF